MKTSHFFNSAAIDDPRAVSIARWPPRWWGSRRRYIALAPSADLLKRLKAGLPWPEYCEEYKRDVLAKLNPARVFTELGQDAILLCWEAPGADCHRRLVAEWLESNLGVKVDECLSYHYDEPSSPAIAELLDSPWRQKNTIV